ncbi:MAG: DUF177 domain-containing protein [Bacteroidia bacterium]|nr:DUF177 domain-containing protein [Bacteroidia bacterium]
MKSLDSFIIPFRGLKPGIHRYDLQIDQAFFEHFEHGEIRNGEFSVHIDLEKEEQMLLFQFTINGNVSLSCNRCNEPLLLPIEGKERLIVKFGEEFSEQDEEVQIIPELERQFDTAPFLYEYIHLLLPIKRVHAEDDHGNSSCNSDMLTKLNELQQNREPDPRWENLEKLRGMKDEGRKT